MPKIIEQPDDTGLVPRLNDALTSRTRLRIGHNKWDRIQHEIEYVLIGRRKYWTDEALAAYVRRQTHKPATLEPKPRRTLPHKAVPVPPKGRRRKADQGERVAQ